MGAEPPVAALSEQRRGIRPHPGVPSFVLDSFALLAYLNDEPGRRRVQALLGAVDQSPIEVMPADRPAVLAAAHVKAHYRLSYAGALVVVAAQASGGTILTGNAEFSAVTHLVSVEWLPTESGSAPTPSL